MRPGDAAPDLRLIWDDNPSVETRDALIRGIDAFNHRAFPSAFERFALLLRDGADHLRGGVVGTMHCSWLLVDGLWVDDGLRRRGIGTALMGRAEHHASGKGCHSAWLTTFQARGFYEKIGYELFGVLDQHPNDQNCHFMRKRFPA